MAPEHLEQGAAATAVPALVDADWLREHLDDPSVVPVEVGPDATSYYVAHVPGAVGLSWLDELHEPDRRGVLSQQRLEHLLSSYGISRDTHVVLYGDSDNFFAAYTYWVLRYYQHPRVSLLDGGRRAWMRAGHPLADAVPERPAVAYVSPGPDAALRASRDEVLEHFVDATGGALLIDCRNASEYRGQASTAVDLPVNRHRLGGHVPGAVNVPTTELVDPDSGLFRPRAELAALFAAQGVRPSSDVAMYCDVGGRSAIGWFVLHDLLGHPRARSYDGGWSEYGSLVGAPVAR